MSRATKILVVFGAVLIALAASGLLQANRDAEISKVQAVEIANQQVDFEPDTTRIRFVRSGTGLRPTWVVSLSTEPTAADEGRLSVVQLSAADGAPIKIVHER